MERPPIGDADAANAAVAADLSEVAALLRARRADSFRVRAYEHAARVIRALPVALDELDAAELRALAGIGPGLQRLLDEHLATGRLRLLDELRREEPPGVGALLTLPLIGLRDARRLAEHGIRDVPQLRALAGDPEGLARLGERLAARVRESLRRVPTVTDPRLPLAAARRETGALADALRTLPGVREVVVAGAVRRGADLVGDFDLLMVLDDPSGSQLAASITGAGGVVRLLRRHPTRLDVLVASGHPAALWSAGPAARGAALVQATGPHRHVAELAARARTRRLALRPDGLRRAGAPVPAPDEDAVYRLLGLAPVPPELREDGAAVPAAAAGTLPALVRAGDLRGDLHVHSDFSYDGVDSLLEMARGAAGRGYDYVAVTDHAENVRLGGMPREAVLARRRTIAEVQQRLPHVRILDAAELNIAVDGDLDYDLDFLLQFDLGVASVHSAMDQPPAVQTERLLAAIDHPAVNVIGHPTGRILGRRPGYRIDLAAVVQAAAETGTALEVNGSPARLDLDGQMARAAVAAGAVLSLSSDAHTVAELDYVANAVPTARRGWARTADVLNAGTLEELLALVAAKRARGA